MVEARRVQIVLHLLGALKSIATNRHGCIPFPPGTVNEPIEKIPRDKLPNTQLAKPLVPRPRPAHARSIRRDFKLHTTMKYVDHHFRVKHLWTTPAEDERPKLVSDNFVIAEFAGKVIDESQWRVDLTEPLPIGAVI